MLSEHAELEESHIFAAPDEFAPCYSWIHEFKKQRGRDLRVLHIGNIANNAYNNAKIQRRYGIEADVLCFDYYHSMATPEWEDGELSTAVDPFLPDWWSTNLKGPRRPSWFVQGPLLLCIGYLAARTNGERFIARVRKCRLEAAYWDLVKDRAKLTGVKRNLSTRRRHIVRRLLISKLDPWKTLAQSLTPSVQSLRDLVLRPLAIAATAKPPLIPGGGMLVALWRFQRLIRKLPTVFDRRNVLNGIDERRILASFSLFSLLANSLKIMGRVILEASIFLLLLPLRLVFGRGKIRWSSSNENKANATALIERFREAEPNVPEGLWAELYRYLSSNALNFNPVLGYYDIIQGYSIDGLIPLANGFKNFTAYEHGTLRDIPFENSLLGLMCRIAYRHAPISFITNSDVIPSAERLGLERAKLRFLPHAFDETKLFRFREENLNLEPPTQYIRIFCPSRHHWKTGEVSWRKGNDALLRGAAIVAARNRNFRITLVEWGQEVDLSKQLIRELGIVDMVEWVQPMGKRALWQAYCTSHAVADQFVMPALGGVGFEAMALGRRLISRIDVAQLSTFFGECPPVMKASSPDEVASAIIAVMDDPQDCAGIGNAGKKWIEHFHSAERIVNIQLSAYKTLLEKNTDCRAR